MFLLYSRLNSPGGYLPGPRGGTWSQGVPAWPGGCTWSWGRGLVPGGVPGLGVYLPGPGGVPGPRGYLPGPGGCTWSQGGCTCLVLGGCTWSWGVPAWSGGMYLVPGGVPGQVLSPPVDRILDTRF